MKRVDTKKILLVSFTHWGMSNMKQSNDENNEAEKHL